MNNFQKILIGIVILLIVINGLLLGFLWINRPRGIESRPFRQRQEMQEFMKKELDLSTAQLSEFSSIHKLHQMRMQKLVRALTINKSKIHRAIMARDTIRKNDVNAAIIQLQIEIENETEEYLSKLEVICNEKQKTKLLRILDEAVERRGPPHHPEQY